MNLEKTLEPFRYKMTLAYDGTNYAGWQVQPNGLSIQQVLQETFFKIFQEKIHVTGSGRTDAGVHALGQVAHFDLNLEKEPYKLLGALNALLPKDIRVMALERVESNFHARYSARHKEYHYHLHLDAVMPPFERLYKTHIKYRLSLDLLGQAAVKFIGTHDFTSFANEADRGSAAHDAVRTITKLDIVKEPGGVRLEFAGDGFLFKMVRNITGTLLEIASQKKDLAAVEKIFAAKDRRLAGQTAPPQGLILVKVTY